MYVNRSHDFHLQQQQQPKSAAAEMDYSVLWCLGPDFDKQSVSNILGDSNSMDYAFMQPTTPTWWMSSPSKWNNPSIMPEPPIYTPRSITSELGPQSPTTGAIKRPFSDVTNRATSKIIVHKDVSSAKSFFSISWSNLSFESIGSN